MKPSLTFIASAMVFFAAPTLQAQQQQQTQPMLGEKAPAFELKGLDGKDYGLAQWKDKVILLHFSTTWCPFCNAEAPNLQQLYQSYKDKGVQVVVIDVKEDKELVAQSLQKYDFSFPVLLDTNGKVAATYAPPDVLPDLKRDEVVLAANLIIDREGKIRFYSLLNSAAFDAKLTEARKKLDAILQQPIVSLSIDTTVVQPGRKTMANIRVTVKEGYHVQANIVNDASLIPVTLRTTPNSLFTIGATIFPPYTLFRLEGAANDQNVFESSFIIRLPIKPSADTKTGLHHIKAQLRYQACDARTCLFPRTIDFELPIVIPAKPSSSPPVSHSTPAQAQSPPPVSPVSTP
ncbi:TlpA family protein disulfide reductase [Puia dinghuensis]|uniref:Thioredoxin domain-containing protein n=1 Tax=Puia dinghuensis TaxID=1792502 RepID=A0A8J2XSB9_9BACT|nr:TlpA disulfide reductase family protein [Puia dinghuensis]GGA93804.1 hypothetical protein GCM10011511_16380 [Puia dinghuensis]